MDFIPLTFAPDVETLWSVNPGACVYMDGFVPMPSGVYGSVTAATHTALVGLDVLTGQMFRQSDGSVRLLIFRKQNIDEYDSSATRTNRGTGYSASTADWSAAAWGNQIIACNYLDATQSSTGGSFSSLSGAPKARHVAANVNFVMLGDVNGSYTDPVTTQSVTVNDASTVWWSALQNPGSWTPDIATQAGWYQLNDAPGPIRALVAYQDSFLAFKDNATFIGQYVGPPFVFDWRLVSNRVGCVAAKSVVECDGCLYFLHTSGFWKFDGQQLSNVGVPVFKTFLMESGRLGQASYINPPGTLNTPDALSQTQATADDYDGNVFFKGAYKVTATGVYKTVFVYVYNVRSGKWGRYTGGFPTADPSTSPCWVRATSADLADFKLFSNGRALMVYPNQSVSNIRVINVGTGGDDTQNTGAPSFYTGYIGLPDRSKLNVSVYLHFLNGSAALTSSDTLVTLGDVVSHNATLNTRFGTFDTLVSARLHLHEVTLTTGPYFLSSLAYNYAPGPRV